MICHSGMCCSKFTFGFIFCLFFVFFKWRLLHSYHTPDEYSCLSDRERHHLMSQTNESLLQRKTKTNKQHHLELCGFYLSVCKSVCLYIQPGTCVTFWTLVLSEYFCRL